MTTNSINLKSPHELLAIVPFVLGFRPTNSIVVLCLRDRRLGLTQRLALPRPEHARQVVLALMPSLVVENPDSVVLIGYEDQPGESLPALEALSSGLASLRSRSMTGSSSGAGGGGRSTAATRVAALHRVRGCPSRWKYQASSRSSLARASAPTATGMH